MFAQIRYVNIDKTIGVICANPQKTVHQLFGSLSTYIEKTKETEFMITVNDICGSPANFTVTADFDHNLQVIRLSGQGFSRFSGTRASFQLKKGSEIPTESITSFSIHDHSRGLNSPLTKNQIYLVLDKFTDWLRDQCTQ